MTPETEAEPKVYETEEYIEPGADSDLPEDVPESTAEGENAGGENENAYVPPAQTVPETSASESSADSGETETSGEAASQEAVETGQESQSERETMSTTSAAGE